MGDFNDIRESIYNYFENQLNIMKNDKPNLASFWETYLLKYIGRLDKLTQQIESINNNRYCDQDLTKEQILLLYITMYPM
jgi:hypothetical protein